MITDNNSSSATDSQPSTIIRSCRVIVRDVAWLADEDAFGRHLPFVSAERRQKALQFKFPMGRALSLGAALLLDEMLQAYGLRELEQQYIIGEHGKPSLTGHPELHFSLSHSGHYVACALGSSELGVDIQHQVKVNGDVVKHVCSEAEIEWLDAQDEADRVVGFLRLWSLKESWFKAVGTGITGDYPYFDLTGSSPFLLNKDGHYRFFEFAFGEGRGALCLPEGDIQPEIITQ